MEIATRERNTAQALYERNCEESDLTLEAVDECVALLVGLQQGSSFVEVKKAQRKVQTFIKKLSMHSAFGHLAKALAEMS